MDSIEKLCEGDGYTFFYTFHIGKSGRKYH